MSYNKTSEKKLPEGNVRVLALTYCEKRKEYIPCVAVYIPFGENSEADLCSIDLKLDYSKCHRDLGGYYFSDVNAYCHLFGWYECLEFGSRLSAMHKEPDLWSAINLETD